MLNIKTKKLKILATSDFHGNSVVAKEVAKKAEKEKADIVVIAGDVLDFGQYAKNLFRPFMDKNESVLFVPGNHDTEEAVDEFVKNYKIKNLDGGYVVFGDIGFFGCGGTNMKFFPHYFTEDQIYYKLKKGFEKIKNIKKKVMITHVHPAGSLIEKFSFSGSPAVRKAIEKFKPDIHICGHIHELEGMEEAIGKTKVLSVGKRGTMIEI
jgi:Icc-related predicted phosphoesterase